MGNTFGFSNLSKEFIENPDDIGVCRSDPIRPRGNGLALIRHVLYLAGAVRPHYVY
jgi:hypothetical protein